LGRSVGSFLVDRQARGLSPDTVDSYASELHYLQAYLEKQGIRTEDAGPLWLTMEGTRLTYWGLRDVMRRRSTAASISVPRLHSFRRAFALGMLKGGADILSISRLLGHADLSILQRYIRQMADDLGEVHHRAGPVDNTP